MSTFGLFKKDQKNKIQEPTQWFKSTCTYCSLGCGIVIGADSNRFMDVGGNHDHPYNKGKICHLGRDSWKSLQTLGRSKTPLFFQRPSPPQEIGWNHALLKMRDALITIQQRFGPSAIGIIAGGKLTVEEYYLLGKLARMGLKTNAYTLALPELTYKYLYGVDLPIGSFEDLESSNTFIVFGEDLSRYNPLLVKDLISFSQKNNGTIIVVSSRDSELSRIANIHVKIKLHSEILFLNCLLSIIIKEGLIDFHAIEKYCEGFEDLKKLVRSYAPEIVYQFLGLSIDTLYEVARIIGKTQRCSFLWTVGSNFHPHRREACKMMHTLAAITGNLFKKGGCSMEICYQPNILGAISSSWTEFLPGQRAFSQESRNTSAKLLNCKVDEIPFTRSWPLKEVIEAAAKGEVKCLWIIGSGLGEWFPDRNLLKQALERVELLIVQDASFPNYFTRKAHIYLPVLHAQEKEGTHISIEKRVNLVQEFLCSRRVTDMGKINPKEKDSPSLLNSRLSDLDVFLRLATLLRFDHLMVNMRDIHGVLQEWQRISQDTFIDYSGITGEKLEQFPGVFVPCTVDNVVGVNKLDINKLPQKIALMSIEYCMPEEEADIYFPLALHIEFDRQPLSYHLADVGKSDVSFIEVHPKDIAKFNLSSERPVTLYSRRGTATLPLKVSERGVPGEAYVLLNSQTRGILNLLGYSENAGQILQTTIRLEQV